MEKTTQGHRLREIWEVEDAVKGANQAVADASQSAKIAQQYHKLTAQNVSAVSLEIDRVNQKLSFAVNEISRLEGLLRDSRNHCLTWGMTGAALVSLIVPLVTAPFNPPQRIVGQQFIEPSRAIVNSVPQVQKPRAIQPQKTVKPSVRRRLK